MPIQQLIIKHKKWNLFGKIDDNVWNNVGSMISLFKSSLYKEKNHNVASFIIICKIYI